MKKIFLIVMLALITQVIPAQKTIFHTYPERLFRQGREMFLGGNYVGAQDLLIGFCAQSDDLRLKEEAEYMLAVASFRRGSEQCEVDLKSFLECHPATAHRHEVQFLIGSRYFDKGEWDTALSWFEQADLDYLTLSEQEDYSFRKAYSLLQTDEKEEAARLFGLLSQNSDKYRDAANFYYGYIDYSNKNYRAALQRFESLKKSSEYAEEVAFYTAQANFFDGQPSEAIRLSEDFLNRFPRSAHNIEINRILGNSYYRLGHPSKAIPFYEKYLAKIEQPLRGDAYFIGLAYFESGQYEQAAEMFQKTIGISDALSQNAQLQLGHTYLKLNRKQPAQMAFEAAARDNFDGKARETALFNYALLAHETNFSVFSESITLFEKFLQAFPQSPYTDQVNDILAATFLTTKDYQAALNAINRIRNPGQRILAAKQTVLFQLGVQEFINGNMNEAVSHFNNSISMGDYDREARNNAYFWRGESHYRMGNFMLASGDFRNFTQSAVPQNKNYALGWYNLGYSLFKQKQYHQAVDAFRQYLSAEKERSRPEYADALNRVGDSFYFDRNFESAERYYAQAADVNPAAADYAAYQRAFVLGLQHNFQGKVNALDQLMRQYPNSQYFDDALYEKSRALTMLNREHEAINVLNQLINDYPNSPLSGQGGVQLGQLYYNNGDHQRSIAAYKKVIATFPGTDDAKNALVSMETVYRDINDIQSYVDYANSLPGGMRITPSKQDSLTYLAAERIYMQGNRTAAETSLTKYLQSYPFGAYSSDAHYYLGMIAGEKNERQSALSHLRKVIDAGNVKFLDHALIYTAQAEYDNGNYRQALADYSRLSGNARSATNKQLGLIGTVRSQSKLENHHETVRAATKLLDGGNLSPETTVEIRYLRGKAYRQINEVEKAMADFRFVGNDTRNKWGAEAQWILADTYYRWKSYDRAEAQVKEFMQKGTPHSYWLARALIVLSDTYKAKGDDFQSKQYLESLKSNYKGKEADIWEMINERLQ